MCFLRLPSMKMELLDYVKKTRGSGLRMARELKVSPVSVTQWARKIRSVPAEHCPEIERITNGQVTCEDLRPDVNWSVLRNTFVPVSKD